MSDLLHNIYQHFRPEERPIIDELFNQTADAINQYRPILTAFLDPRRRYILTTIVNHYDDIKVQFYAPDAHAERKRALIYPDYYAPQPDDFAISVLQIDYPQKFAHLAHGQILGTLLGAGIKRELVGDLLAESTAPDENAAWQVVVAQSLAQWLPTQVTQIGKIHVKLKPLAPDASVLPLLAEGTTATLTVSSLRLDTVVSAVTNYSRQRVKTLIQRKLVNLNFAPITTPQTDVGVHDLISLRHYGRIQLKAIGGMTKKAKIRLEVLVIKNK